MCPVSRSSPIPLTCSCLRAPAAFSRLFTRFVGLLGNSSRRTINLGLSARGEAALATLGLYDEAMTYSVRYTRRIIYLPGQPRREQLYSDGIQGIHSVSRSKLSMILWQQLRAWKEKAGSRFVISSLLIDVYA